VRTHPVDKLLEQHCFKSATGLLQLVRFYVVYATELYTRKNLTSCNKFVNKPSTSCFRTACHKLSTSLEQAVTICNNLVGLLILSDLLQGCSNKSGTIMI
jgi:hypothetical protein